MGTFHIFLHNYHKSIVTICKKITDQRLQWCNIHVQFWQCVIKSADAATEKLIFYGYSHYNWEQPKCTSENFQNFVSQKLWQVAMSKTKYNIHRPHAMSPGFFKVIRIKVKVAPLDHVENHKMGSNSKSINARDVKLVLKCS